jgi:hypothetical protein
LHRSAENPVTFPGEKNKNHPNENKNGAKEIKNGAKEIKHKLT